MFFLPSLLEYSQESLEKRLNLVASSLPKFKQTQGSQNSKQVFFHLDFVLEYFAKDRFVMQSLGLESLLESLKKEFLQIDLNLSVHLMGNSVDLTEIAKLLPGLDFPKNWQLTIFVPPKFVNYFETIKNSNQSVGIWLDLDQWENFDFKEYPKVQDYLLMTVLAGKSGQKLLPQTKAEALKMVQNNPNLEFILDGGWSIDFESSLTNLKVVSYSSFWKKFEG